MAAGRLPPYGNHDPQQRPLGQAQVLEAPALLARKTQEEGRTAAASPLPGRFYDLSSREERGCRGQRSEREYFPPTRDGGREKWLQTSCTRRQRRSSPRARGSSPPTRATARSRSASTRSGPTPRRRRGG